MKAESGYSGDNCYYNELQIYNEYAQNISVINLHQDRLIRSNIKLFCHAQKPAVRASPAAAGGAARGLPPRRRHGGGARHSRIVAEVAIRLRMDLGDVFHLCVQLANLALQLCVVSLFRLKKVVCLGELFLKHPFYILGGSLSAGELTPQTPIYTNFVFKR